MAFDHYSRHDANAAKTKRPVSALNVTELFEAGYQGPDLLDHRMTRFVLSDDDGNREANYQKVWLYSRLLLAHSRDGCIGVIGVEEWAISSFRPE